jgi:hypothetical protein
MGRGRGRGEGEEGGGGDALQLCPGPLTAQGSSDL